MGAYFLDPGFKEFVDEAWDVFNQEDPQAVEKWAGQFGIWAPLILLLCFLVQLFAFVLPSWLLILVCILAYGPFWGSLLAFTGIALASSVAYALGDYLGEYTVERLLGRKTRHKMEHYLASYGFSVVLIFRLAPFLSNDTISFVAGLVEMRFLRFLAATLLGIAPLIGMIAYLGGSYDRLRNGLIWVSVLSLIGLVVYIWWDRRQMKKKGIGN